MRLIAFAELMQAIEDSTVSKTVKVPSRDYYSRHGDTEDDTFVYVCPHKLIQALQGISEE